MENTKTVFDSFVNNAGVNDSAQVQQWFAGLPAAESAELLGDWQGGLIATGHAGEGQLDSMGWVGKRFNSVDDVNPLIVHDQDGQRVVSEAMGKATLKMIRVDGTVSATMVYDKHPIFDHFRALDENTLIGRMDAKGDSSPLFFYLERIS